MSYKALYRTYRPQTFEEVAGQKQIIQTLKNAIKENKVAHAYLFTGPRGTGKTTMAKLLAKALNCESNNGPCNECENCKAINEGSYPDVIEIDAASNNGVDEVRNLIDKVKYAPIQGKYKIYIIDEVHMMSQGAFNALLKTLEEPPAHVIFVLATTEPHKVLPTILSRCQRFDFGRISRSDIEERLKTILEKEDIVYDDGVIELVSELCDGGMRDALSILDQAIAYAGDAITLEDIRKIYGIVSNEEKIEFLELIDTNNHQELLNKINEYDDRGIDISRLTNNLIDVIKEVIIYKSAQSFKGLKVINESNCHRLERITNKKLFSMIDILLDALSGYRKAGAPRVLFEIACLKMCGLNDINEERVIYKEVIKEVKQESAPIETNSFANQEPTIEETITESDTKEESLESNQEEILEEVNEPNFVSENVSHETEEAPTIKLESEAKVDNDSDEESEKTSEIEKPLVEETPIEYAKEEKIETSEANYIEETEAPKELASYSMFPSEEELLNVLVQATKDALVKAKQQWVMMPKYLNTIATAKVAGILLDGIPVAACDNVIVVGYNSDVYLNRIYSQGNYEEMNSFLRALYNSDVKCYCLTIKEFTALREKYMTLRQLGKLPKPIPIVIQKRNINVDTTNNKDEGIEYARKLFGNNVIIKEED